MRLPAATLSYLSALTFFAHADMGSIPFKKGARIIEPRQDAIIAWNGREQLLYLQTTLGASEETKVLEVMPLPNEPTVEASEIGVFQRCAFLLPRQPGQGAGGGGPFGEAAGPPAARITERKLIGAHDLRTVELLDAKRFSDWVSKEFQAEGNALEVPVALLEVIDDYAQEGFRWFLFDVVDVGEALKKKTPLRIRFKSDHLYYPMRITRTEKGPTTVSLAILTNVLFTEKDCVGIPRELIELPAQPREIPGVKVKWIDPPIFELLGHPETAKLRSWRISGEIDSFEKDLLVRNPGS